MTVRSSVLNLEVSSSNQGSATRRPVRVSRRSAKPVDSDTSTKRPLGPALRANPYPEVTDLFCRLPLSTLIYQLEAAHLGDLMRL